MFIVEMPRNLQGYTAVNGSFSVEEITLATYRMVNSFNQPGQQFKLNVDPDHYILIELSECIEIGPGNSKIKKSEENKKELHTWLDVN